MVNITQIHRDVVIVGAGIAGLWLHAHLRQNGFRTIIIENQALGNGQTIASQGIIHGGTKYTLTGKITGAARSLTDMPQRWRRCIKSTNSENLPDLTQARILAEHQFLCSEASLASKFTAFAARKIIRSKVTQLAPRNWPSFLKHPSFRGSVHQLDEPVLDIPSILRAFLQHIPPGEILLTDHVGGLEVESKTADNRARLRINHHAAGALSIHTTHLIFTAGAGNEQLAELLPAKTFKTQRRPLHMVLARFPPSLNQQTPAIYSHFLGQSALPRATITTHHTRETNHTVLYIGGEIAESGVTRSRNPQIKTAQALLQQIIPAYPLEQAEWATFRIDRAEPVQPQRKRPDNAVFSTHGNIIAAWPTKLALAPVLADKITQYLSESNQLLPKPDHHPDSALDSGLTAWPRPAVATAPWDEEDLQWTK